ncbi:MAG TPA: nucleoside diphosphate kinase regulator [Polyangiaceae bacterium]|nr:nucleoside diphosphate kinase regulator [Polyangiaceae bacterium]
MSLPPIHLRASDQRTLEHLVQSASEGPDADSAARLDEELARATVVPDHALPAGTVALHSRVRVRDETTQRVRDVTLVLPHQAAPAQSHISILSPLGLALIGLATRDRIDWPLPGGKHTRLRVLHVD